MGIEDLDAQLNTIIRKLGNASVSSNANQNAPIDKRNLVALQKEVVVALNSFRKVIVEYLAGHADVG